MISDNRGVPDPNSPSTELQVIRDLEELASSPGFIYALARATIANTFFSAEAIPHPAERLSVKELTLVAAFMAAEPIDLVSLPEEVAFDAHLDQLYALLQRLQETVGEPTADATSPIRPQHSARGDPPQLPKVPIPGRALVEPFFYTGTGAYDFQYLEFAQEKYRRDSLWLESHAGLSMDLLTTVATQLQDLRERRIVNFIEADTHEDWCRTALAMFSFTREDLSFLTPDQFDAFLDKFSVTPGTLIQRVNKVGDLNDLEIKPIIRLGQDHFFMPVGFMLTKSIYESPSYWMARDDLYRNQAATHRGTATEEIAHRLLSPVFGNKVYKNVAVMDDKRTVHEIDVLAVAGNRAIVIQAKAKRLTALARQGDDEQVKKDFSQAVQEAYEQGLNSRRFLLAGTHGLLDGDGNEVNLPDSFQDVYLVCLTLDHFPALPFVTERFLDKDPDDPLPVALSIFDLDLVATYLTNPLEFTHYIYQRSRWSGRISATSEASFLGWYLDRGLTLPQTVTGALLTENMASAVDKDFPAIRGRNRLMNELSGFDSHSDSGGGLRSRWQDSELNDFIPLLKESSDPRSTDALFTLFDLPEEGSRYFFDRIVEAAQNCADSSELSYCSILLDNKTGFCFVCFPGPSGFEREALQQLVAILKHKNKADKWIGFGMILASPGIGFVYADEPWQASRELDEDARELLQPDVQLTELDGGDLCWCESGQKYEECHA